MRNIAAMMKKAGEMQEKIANLEAVGTAGGGLVTIILNGKGAIKAVTIDDSVVNPEEREILEDLILAAHNDAKAKVELAIANKTQEMMAGLPIPPGFNLPF
ncbi:MAG: hypothetical protein JSC161_000917 [Candidatus Tokpelaia sp. JSC161]|jgi:hypothetical protein|nr:MAG: hypothetical protein JSC161_000917 [Candidatus Tokpelaia sp. JSC161]